MPLQIPPDFDALYRADPDPWQVATSWYERRKRDVLLASLTKPRYRRGWDAACGTGVLAVELAPRCAQLLASDASEQAVALTQSRCSALGQIAVEQVRLPADASRFDDRRFDLVILSEFLYYLDDIDRAATLRRAVQWTTPDAEIVLAHWRHTSDDAWTSGQEANVGATRLLNALGWETVVHHDDHDFVLDVVARIGPESTAR